MTTDTPPSDAALVRQRAIIDARLKGRKPLRPSEAADFGAPKLDETEPPSDAARSECLRQAAEIAKLREERDAAVAALARERDGEREARHKCEAALTAKDKAMGVLFERLTAAGVDCSDLIP